MKNIKTSINSKLKSFIHSSPFIHSVLLDGKAGKVFCRTNILAIKQKPSMKFALCLCAVVA
ncbi:MAG: hypothetical protein Q8L68_04195, partial [Methylococcales bacterium]|nr:hypothetical protein [Methylococcales bacterium]